MKTDISPELIRKYIGGGCTPDEIERVHEWYASFEKEADPLIDLELKEQLELKMRMLGQIRTNIRLQHANSGKRSKVLLYSWAAASAAVLIVVFGLLVYRPAFKNEPETNNAYAANEVHISNPESGLQKHTLSDGTVVWLSPLASISYNKGFEPDSRKVSINGDVFFDVTKDKKRPFIIYGGGVITKVWGTSFSIAYNKITQATEVAVLTGKVSVCSDDSGEDGTPEERRERREPGDHGVMLLPNEKAVYAKNGHKLSKDKIAAGSAVSIWKKEDVLFDNITVNEIVKVLNVKFDVNITVADKALNSYVLKADFTGQSLPEILLIMEKSLNMTYTIDGTAIVLRQLK